MLHRCLAKVGLILDEVESTVQGILPGLYTMRPRGWSIVVTTHRVRMSIQGFIQGNHPYVFWRNKGFSSLYIVQPLKQRLVFWNVPPMWRVCLWGVANRGVPQGFVVHNPVMALWNNPPWKLKRGCKKSNHDSSADGTFRHMQVQKAVECTVPIWLIQKKNNSLSFE
jgi:hypothetical protein